MLVLLQRTDALCLGYDIGTRKSIPSPSLNIFLFLSLFYCITIWCSRIICTVSLLHRCEFGHLYGNDSLDASIDMSPICLATDGYDDIERYSSNKCNSTYDSDSSNEIEEQEVEQGAVNCKFCSTLKNSELASTSSDESDSD